MGETDETSAWTCGAYDKAVFMRASVFGMSAVAQSGDEQYTKIFRKEKNYIAVSMVVVLREFQGKGFMHKVLAQPFDEARKKNIPCVLDTDTPVKVEKYIRCGMKLVGEKKLRHGVSLYTMAYNDNR